MYVTIRNLDEKLYRELEARAARAGKTMGEVVNEAMEAYLARPVDRPRQGSLADLSPEDFPEGNECMSKEIDSIVYEV